MAQCPQTPLPVSQREGDMLICSYAQLWRRTCLRDVNGRTGRVCHWPRKGTSCVPLGGKHAVCCRGRFHLIPKAAHTQTSLQRCPNKSSLCLACKASRNTKDPWKIVSQHPALKELRGSGRLKCVHYPSLRATWGRLSVVGIHRRV